MKNNAMNMNNAVVIENAAIAAEAKSTTFAAHLHCISAVMVNREQSDMGIAYHWHAIDTAAAYKACGYKSTAAAMAKIGGYNRTGAYRVLKYGRFVDMVGGGYAMKSGFIGFNMSMIAAIVDGYVLPAMKAADIDADSASDSDYYDFAYEIVSELSIDRRWTVSRINDEIAAFWARRNGNTAAADIAAAVAPKAADAAADDADAATADAARAALVSAYITALDAARAAAADDVALDTILKLHAAVAALVPDVAAATKGLNIA